MIEKFPSMNEYWADKRAAVSRINVPMYVLASYSTGLHTRGSFRGFTEAQSDQKWYCQLNLALSKDSSADLG